MVTSTEEGDSIVSQAILVKKNLAEGLKVHLRSGRFQNHGRGYLLGRARAEKRRQCPGKVLRILQQPVRDRR